ncbi:hypothetical protein, partial [uncultured Thiodictyon sp.]|uniref:hypothetical protein n=1 Tax=uncultured Thiodictyon sp. TaxID=1846217 RepID=UPI0025D63457
NDNDNDSVPGIPVATSVLIAPGASSDRRRPAPGAGRPATMPGSGRAARPPRRDAWDTRGPGQVHCSARTPRRNPLWEQRGR